MRTCKHAHGRKLALICLQGLAFVGSEVITFNALVTCGLQSEWVAAFIKVNPHSPQTPLHLARSLPLPTTPSPLLNLLTC